MHTIHRSVKPVTLAILAILCMPTAQAELVNEAWVVRSGDGLYSIARKLAPKDLKMQVRIRSEITQLNPGVNTENLEIGLNLKLPSFLFKQPAPVVAPAVLPELPAPVQISKPAVATPDPAEVIGKVVIQSGQMVAENRGSTRKLNRTASILKGDTLKTADNTRSQIRMKDGALIALSPDTELRIENYAYNGSEDGTERSVINLIRGGFRTITGAIGHVNKQNYQVKTSVATIGIRGTHYGLMLCEGGSCQNNPNMGNLNDGLYGGVVDGSVVADNASGQFAFNNDQYFHIQSNQAPPVETLLPPPVFQDTAPQGGDQPPRDDMANGPKPEGADGQRPDDRSADGSQGMGPDGPKQGMGPDNSPDGHMQGMGPDSKGPDGGPMQGMGPNGFPGQPGPGSGDGMMAGDFQFNRNPMGMNFFNNDFLPPKDFQFMPGQQPPPNTSLPPPAPTSGGIAIAFTNTVMSGGVAVPIYMHSGSPNGIFLESTIETSGNVVNNLPFAIHEEHDIFDPNTSSIVGHQVHDVVRTNPEGAGAEYRNLGGNAAFGVNWGRWYGNFVLLENGVPLMHDGNLHFIYSDRLTPKDTLFNLGGVKARAEFYGVIGGTFPTDNLGNVGISLPHILVAFDFVNHQMIHYEVRVDNFSSLTNPPPAWMVENTMPVDFSYLDKEFNLGTGDTMCGATCITGHASLIFTGDYAGAAMTSYSIYDPAYSYGLSGAALLAPYSGAVPNGSALLVAAAETTNTPPVAFPFLVQPGSLDNIYLGMDTYNTIPVPVAALDHYTDTNGASHYTGFLAGPLANPSEAAATVNSDPALTSAGIDNYWGRWDNANVALEIMGVQGVTHFIGSSSLTTPAQLGGLTGTANYTIANGGNAFDANFNSATASSLTVSMTTDFTAQVITAYSVNVNGGAISGALQQSGTALPVPFTQLSQGFALVDTAFCTGCVPSGTAAIQFVGPQAEGALTSFSLIGGTNTAAGVALLTQ